MYADNAKVLNDNAKVHTKVLKYHGVFVLKIFITLYPYHLAWYKRVVQVLKGLANSILTLANVSC